MSSVGPQARRLLQSVRAAASVALVASSIAALGACASVGSSSFDQGTQGPGGSGRVVSFGDGGGTTALLGGDGGVSSDGGNEQLCNDGGCSCIRIASIGHEGIWGACGMYGDGTAAFENWLSTQSTATVDSFSTSKPTLTADFLKPYDVIILQWLRDVSDAGSDGALWQFSQDEIDALSAWVRNGGGLITLSGYDGDGQETVPLNQLLSFTDFKYNTDGTYGNDCNGCWGGACALGSWNASSPIGAHITEIGMQFGRSISVHRFVVRREHAGGRLPGPAVLVQRDQVRVVRGAVLRDPESDDRALDRRRHFVPKRRSPASPMPGTMYPRSSSRSSTAAV